MAYDSRLGYDPKLATYSAQGKIGYTNPGPVIDYYDPEKGLTLKPLKMTEILPPGLGGSLPLDDLVMSLIQSMAPSGRPAETPLSYNLPGIYSDMVKQGTDYGEQYFQDLISRIGAPSSVDAVQKGLETEEVRQLMEDIDRMTRGNVASAKLDYLDRGIAGPGQIGDIEANAIAQLMASGERTKASAKLGAFQSELGRQKAREEAVNTAYGKRYEVGSAADIQSRNLIAQLLGEEYKGGVTQREGVLSRASSEKMNYFNQILDYAIKSGTLSQDDAQFYAELISKEQMAAAENQSAYDRAILGTRKPDKDFFDQLTSGLSVAKGLVDIGGGLFGKTQLPPGQAGRAGGLF